MRDAFVTQDRVSRLSRILCVRSFLRLMVQKSGSPFDMGWISTVFNSVSYITGGTGFLPSTISFPFLAHCPFQGDVANEMASRFASSKSNGEYMDLDTFLFEGCPTLRRWGRWGRWGNGLAVYKFSRKALQVCVCVFFSFSLLTEIARISYQETLRLDQKQPQQRNRHHPISSITTQKLNGNPRWAPSLYS